MTSSNFNPYLHEPPLDWVIFITMSILPCSDESWCLSTEEEEDEKEAWHLHGEQESEGLVRGRANLNRKIITNAD